MIVESVQVMSSMTLYNASRTDIRRYVSAIIGFRSVGLARIRRFLRALALYDVQPRLSFVDALLAAYAEESSPATVLSFDRGFDRVAGLTREEP